MTLEELLEGVVLPIDKPRQWTSFQAVGKVRAVIRNHYGIKKFKIGHAGTLDPLATGLLLVCVGKATKRIDELQSGEKVYSGTMVLGATTPCFDLERPIDHYYPFAHITTQLISDTLPQFTGNIQQVPPMFSAVKINGQRAYQYARQGNTSDESVSAADTPLPTPKEVHVAQFEITDFRPGDPDRQVTDAELEATASVPTELHHLYNNPLGVVPDHLPQLDFRIRCGKGTYIRSIARDLGLALDSGAFLASLRREQIGNYTISQAIAPDQVEQFLLQ